MDARARDIISIGKGLFAKKRPVDSLWQEIALNFYPERADFTEVRNEGSEFSDHLFSSYPVLARRELGNLMSSNLRPQSKRWFELHVDSIEVDEESEERRFLEYLTEIQWRAMYDSGTGFVNATKATDHDFAAFGNGVIYGSANRDLSGLLFKNYHLRDCAWAENYDGSVDEMHRVWNPTAKQLKSMFGDKVSNDVKKACEKDPHKKFECRHVVMPKRQYQNAKPNGEEYEFTSLIVEIESETVLEEVGMDYFPYVVPRWQKMGGNVFGSSMATAIALPDGRTMQVVIRTLREAGEKYVDPPMIAYADAIRGDIPLYPGGITIADMEYDERLGEVLRPITQQSGNLPIGIEIAQALREDIRHAFFLDKITLPDPQNTDMTAYETRRRLEEHIRSASPLFEPIETEMSAPVCELAFAILKQHNAFPMHQMPDALDGAETDFTFRSPLTDLTEETEAAAYSDVLTRVFMPAAQVDPAQLENMDLTTATRDAARNLGWKEKWFKPREAVDEKRQQLMQQQAAQQALLAAQQGGQVVEQGGKAAQAVQQAEAGGQA